MAVIYLCPADKRLLCPWEGCAKDIKQHFEKEHAGLLFHTNFVEIDLHLLDKNRLLNLNGEIYLIQSYLQDDNLLIKLRYLGLNDAASSLQFGVAIIVHQVCYKYDPSRKVSWVTPYSEGWEVNLKSVENFHGKLESVICRITVESKIEKIKQNIRRQSSTRSLNINNRFVERNAYDETEVEILEDLRNVDERIKQLKASKDDESIDSDSISDLSVLEYPLFGTKGGIGEEIHKDNLTEILPNIREGNESDKEVLFHEEHNLSCSSCTQDMLPPIYLCLNGHNVCTFCKSEPCKICNESITEDRNTNLEEISRKQEHACKYFSSGCMEKVLYNELRAHEARCQHCKYKCPLEGCPHEGRFQDFHNHLKVIHTSTKVQMQTRFDFPKNTSFFVVNASVGIFYCSSDLKGEYITWRVHFCGPKERQFFCELTFKGSKRKELIFLKRHDNSSTVKRQENIYELTKSVAELKKHKAKEKYASLTITSYDT